MDNLWILTEERPKTSVILEIIRQYCAYYSDRIVYESELKILPLVKDECFLFSYLVTGISLQNVKYIFIKTVSGDSSFLDFLVFKQPTEPQADSSDDKPIMAFEETKTSDDESRNTGVYQRGSKFVFIENFYPNTKLFMLYNDELECREDKKPSDTSVFGTNILLTLGVSIIVKNNKTWFRPFNNISDLISFKNSMRKPPKGNIPIDIKLVSGELITISGRLSKPKEAGNISHDPNIGALSMISKCLRKLGWKKRILITNHGVSQEYINRTHGNNKFLFICKLLNLELENINLPITSTPNEYWHYEHSSEKVTSIFIHMCCLYTNNHTVYENHAGCERGYFRDKLDNLYTLPKKDKDNENLLLPDCVIFNAKQDIVLLIEGKKLLTLKNGLEEVENYHSIEDEYIAKYYPTSTISRWVTIFGGSLSCLPDEKVIVYISEKGNIYLNDGAPEFVKDAYQDVKKDYPFLNTKMY